MAFGRIASATVVVAFLAAGPVAAEEQTLNFRLVT